MEPFGHVLSGICLAQALRPADGDAQPRGWWPAAGGVAAFFPDIDAVTYLAGADSFQRYHQFYTHNLIAFAIGPALLTVALRKLAKNPPSFGRALAVVQGGWALHLVGDTIAHWPLRLFWPFSRTGISFELIPRDFSFGLAGVLLVGTTLSFVDDVRPYRRVIAIATLLAATAYVLFSPGW